MKVTNDVLKEAMKLERMIRVASKRLSEIKQDCKDQGSFCTRDFAVSVYDQSAERLAPKDDFFAFYDREDLREKGLLKTSTFQIVKIAAKAPAKKKESVAA